MMLDANFNERLGDFRLAMLMHHDRSHVSTLTTRTMGYLGPEYLVMVMTVTNHKGNIYLDFVNSKPHEQIIG